MGSGASSDLLFDVAKDLQLNHEQRLRFKAFYNELLLKGIPESSIRERLVQKFKLDKGGELNEAELRSASKIVNIHEDEIKSARVFKTNSLNKPNSISETNVIKSNHNVVDDLSKLKCEICNTSFKTVALLERHIKYSYIHARAVEDQEKLHKQQERAKRIATMIHNCLQVVRKTMLKRDASARNNKVKMRWLWAYEKVKINIAIAKTTKELVAYYRSNLKTQKINKAKMLFDGSKLFWRTQESIELNIYLHDDEKVVHSIPDKSPVLEVIGFDVSKQKEFQRLYVNFYILQTHLYSKIETAIHQLRHKINKESATYTAISTSNETVNIYKLNDDEEKSVMYQIIVDYIVSKLDLRNHPNRPTQKGLVLGDATDDIMTDVSLKQKLPLSATKNISSCGSSSEAQNLLMSSASSTAFMNRPPSDISKFMSPNKSYINSNSSSSRNNINDSLILNNSIDNINSPSYASPYNILNVSTAVPENVFIDESRVLKFIQPVEIIRRRHTTEAERNIAFEDFNQHATELSYYTNKANNFSTNTNIQPHVRKGLKHDDSVLLDDVVAKYAAMLKESSPQSEQEYKSDKAINNKTKHNIAPKTNKIDNFKSNTNNGEGMVLEKTVIINNTNEENKKSYMRSTASQNPDAFSVVTKTVVTGVDGTFVTSVTAAEASLLKSSNNQHKEKDTKNLSKESKTHAAGSGLAAVKSICTSANPTGGSIPHLPFTGINLSAVKAAGSKNYLSARGDNSNSNSVRQQQLTGRSSKNSGRISSRQLSEPVMMPISRDPLYLLTQVTVGQQREESLALQEMIRSAQNTPRSNSGQTVLTSSVNASAHTNLATGEDYLLNSCRSVGPGVNNISLSKLPEIPEHEHGHDINSNNNSSYDIRASAGGLRIISSESLNKKLIKKLDVHHSHHEQSQASSPTNSTATMSTQETNDHNAITVSMSPVSHSQLITGKTESALIKQYFEQRIDATDHTPLVSARRALNEVILPSLGLPPTINISNIASTNGTKCHSDKVVSPLDSSR